MQMSKNTRINTAGLLAGVILGVPTVQAASEALRVQLSV